MSKCLLCGLEIRPLFSARDYIGDDSTVFHLNWCARCEFGRLDGNFKPEQVTSFYPKNYYTHGVLDKTPDPSTPMEKLRVYIAWRRDHGHKLGPEELPKYRSVCDVGCGDGYNLRQFSRFGYETVGVEPDAIARSRANESGAILNGTAEALPDELSGKTFDVVLMSHVLEHCIDPKRAIANARRLIKPNGRLVIEVPNNGAKGFSTYHDLWPWTDIPRHLSFFTERSLRSIIQTNGMKVEMVRYVGYVRQFAPEWIHKQREIWYRTRSGRTPNFNFKAWLLLASTAFSSDARKYDSIRIIAAPD
jgi:2-polyprenyl-3-methyl-5-hydroxy-6-metoxy-1,4-benzoquinol methylase